MKAKIILLSITSLLLLSGCSFPNNETNEQELSLLKSGLILQQQNYDLMQQQISGIQQQIQEIKTILMQPNITNTASQLTTDTIKPVADTKTTFTTSYGKFRIDLFWFSSEIKNVNGNIILSLWKAFQLDVLPKRTLKEIISDGEKDKSPMIIIKPRKKIINNLNVIERSEGGMMYYTNIEVLGEKANYKFMDGSAQEGKEESSFQKLEKYIETFEEL